MEKEYEKARFTQRSFATMNEQGINDGWSAIRQCYSRLTKGWYCPKLRKANGEYRVVKSNDKAAQAVIIDKKEGYRWSIWRMKKYLDERTHANKMQKYATTPVWKIVVKDYVYYFIYYREVNNSAEFGA